MKVVHNLLQLECWVLPNLWYMPYKSWIFLIKIPTTYQGYHLTSTNHFSRSVQEPYLGGILSVSLDFQGKNMLLTACKNAFICK